MVATRPELAAVCTALGLDPAALSTAEIADDEIRWLGESDHRLTMIGAVAIGSMCPVTCDGACQLRADMRAVLATIRDARRAAAEAAERPAQVSYWRWWVLEGERYLEDSILVGCEWISLAGEWAEFGGILVTSEYEVRDEGLVCAEWVARLHRGEPIGPLELHQIELRAELAREVEHWHSGGEPDHLGETVPPRFALDVAFARANRAIAAELERQKPTREDIRYAPVEGVAV